MAAAQQLLLAHADARDGHRLGRRVQALARRVVQLEQQLAREHGHAAAAFVAVARQAGHHVRRLAGVVHVAEARGNLPAEVAHARGLGHLLLKVELVLHQHQHGEKREGEQQPADEATRQRRPQPAAQAHSSQ